MKKTLTIVTVVGMMLTAASIFAARTQATNGGLYILPVGSQVLWSNVNNIPEDFICEAPNKEVSQAQYPELYKVIGDIYGAPASSDNFVLPYNPVPVPSPTPVDRSFSSVGTLNQNTTYQAPQDMFVFSYAGGGHCGGGLRMIMGKTPDAMTTVSQSGSGYLDEGGSSIFCAVPAGDYFSVSHVRSGGIGAVLYIELGQPSPVPPVGDFASNPDQNVKSNITNQCWIIKAA